MRFPWILAAVLLALPGLGETSAPKADPPAGLVLTFAREHLGRKVGDGQCSALVSSALSHAGLAPHTFGRKLDSIREVRPGDILEFDDAEFRIRSGRGRSLRTSWARFPHHVAIVSEVLSSDGPPVVAILHQNAGLEASDPASRQVVQRWTLRFSTMTRGTVQAYRPGE